MNATEAATGEAVGIIAAAGLGSRLLPFAYPKELLPIVYSPDGEGGVQPRPVMQYSLEALACAGVRRCLVVVSDAKFEVARVFGDGGRCGLSLAYLVRNTPRGLADAIDAALPWAGSSDVCVALPDTIVKPRDAMSQLRRLRKETGADVVLGVFPTATPEQLGPVRFDAAGRVLEVLDKPERTDLRNTWGLAVWSATFSAFLRRAVAEAPEGGKPALGHVFHAACRCAMDVRACRFEDGSFADIGTPETLGRVVLGEQR